MNEGQARHRGSLKLSDTDRALRSVRRIAFALVAVLFLLNFSWQARAQQTVDKYIGYSPRAKADSANAAPSAKAKAKPAAKSKSKSQAAGKRKPAIGSSATTQRGPTADKRDVSAKVRGESAKKRAAAKKKSDAATKNRDATAKKRASRRTATAAKPPARTRSGTAKRPASTTSRLARAKAKVSIPVPMSKPDTGGARSKQTMVAAPPAGAISSTALKSAVPAVALPQEISSSKGSPAARRSAGDIGETIRPWQPGALAAGIAVPLTAGAFGAFLYWRRRQSADTTPAPHVDPTMDARAVEVALASIQIEADLMQRAEPFFVDLRRASVRKDHEFIMQHCTEDMATSLILDSAVAETPAAPQVEGLKAELVDLFEEVNRYVASVQYTADEQFGNHRPRKVREVWHFVREPDASDWRLAAVEPA